jgi:hypothetical protein
MAVVGKGVTGPRLDERSVHAEVLAREQAFIVGLLQHPIDTRLKSSITASSMARPMNQRNRRLYWVCSMSWRSERMLEEGAPAREYFSSLINIRAMAMARTDG